MAASSNQRQVNTRAIFRKYDKDTDGFISVKDLINVFKELGEEISEEELREHLRNTGIKNLCENCCNFETFEHLYTHQDHIVSTANLQWHISPTGFA